MDLLCLIYQAKFFKKNWARKKLLEMLGNRNKWKVGNYILVKGNPKGKSYLQIYTIKSFKKAQNYLKRIRK